MLFNKYLRPYYIKYSWLLLLGVASLFAVDWAQHKIPELYGALIDGLDPSTAVSLDLDMLLELCFKAFIFIAVLVVGRFAWRICFFNSANGVEAGLRSKLFAHSVILSQQYYQVN